MEDVLKLIYSAAASLPILLVIGAGWKYLPVVKKFANEGVIPVLNALVVFFTALGGGTAVAHASILGDIGSIASLSARAGLSMIVSLLASKIADKFVKPITPKSPYTLAKGGA